jgi:AcrR family transcriptional regulator
MAKRQARFTTEDLVGQPDLDDDSPDLWPEGLGDVPRRLLTSAVRCFASNGYHATTTRDISGGVGLSPAAMYVHFPSKELVLFEIIRAAHVAARDQVRELVTRPDTEAGQRLHDLVFHYTVWHARHHVAARVAQFELSGLTSEHFDEIVAIRRETNDVFRSAISAGVDDGSFGDVDVRRITRALLSLSIDLVRWYRRGGAESPEELGTFNADLALRLVARPPA